MEELIRQIEKDLDLLLRDKTLSPLRKELNESVDLRAARLIIFSLQWSSVGYQSALRFAGAKVGQAIGTNFAGRELSLILKDLKKIFEGLKWGRVETGIDIKNKKISLRLIDSLTSAGAPNINQTLCFFEEGFIEGCLDGIIKIKGALTLAGLTENVARVDVKETKCVGLGADFCEFTVTLGS
ncbi:MAG: hypothetical protein ACE5J0_03375 [Candidatus Paceibacterales bacterium]